MSSIPKLPAFLIAILLLPLAAAAATVNVDFNGNSGTTVGNSNIGTAVFPAGNGTFNGLTGTSFVATPLVDSSGNPTSVTLTGSAPAENSSQSDSTNAGTNAFQDCIVTLDASTGSTTGTQTATITLNGLTGASYNLYLFGYFTADTASRERTQFTVNALTPQSTGGALSATTGFNLAEDYVLFSNVAPISNAIAITFQGDPAFTRQVGVFNGFQLVNAPEPAALSMLGVLSLGLLVRRPRGVMKSS